MEKIRIEVDKVILYYMDRVDPDGNLYRFYVYKGMASEIEYFCTEEAGNMTIPIGEGEYVKIVPKEIEKIPVRGYRKLAERWRVYTISWSIKFNGPLYGRTKQSIRLCFGISPLLDVV